MKFLSTQWNYDLPSFFSLNLMKMVSERQVSSPKTSEDWDFTEFSHRSPNESVTHKKILSKLAKIGFREKFHRPKLVWGLRFPRICWNLVASFSKLREGMENRDSHYQYREPPWWWRRMRPRRLRDMRSSEPKRLHPKDWMMLKLRKNGGFRIMGLLRLPGLWSPSDSKIGRVCAGDFRHASNHFVPR